MMSLISALSKKLWPPGNGVRNALLAQRLLDDARLVVAAVQDRVVGPLVLALEAVGRNHDRHLLGFLLVVLHAQHLDRLAQAVLGPQRLFEQLGVVADHRVGRLQDARGGAVVLLQLDDLQVGEVDLQRASGFPWWRRARRRWPGRRRPPR
jgi:hypothetical protein